jgi:hypothetical protein
MRVQNTWWRKDSLFYKCCLKNWIRSTRRLKCVECRSLPLTLYLKQLEVHQRP